MNMDQALQTFYAESRELLEDMEASLLRVREEAEPAETINAIFRAAHTIKGSAGLFGLDQVVAFTHVVESVLDEVREGRLAVDEPMVALLLACGDHIGALVDAVESDADQVDPALLQRGEPLLARLRAHLAPAGAVVASAAPELSFERIGGAPHDADLWHISLRFGPDVLRNGMDPLSFIRFLGTLGQVVGIVTLADALPAADEMDPESCYLGFEIAFRSQADKAAIEGVFDFVLDDCTLRIVPPHSRIGDYIDLIKAMPEESSRLGEMLVRCGTVTAHELEAALNTQARAVPTPLIGAVLVEQGRVSPPVVEAALEKQKRVKDAKTQESQSIRVDADKLDHLINLVGELIIASAGANLVARKTRNSELQECHSVLSGLVEEVRDSALQLRMVKIGGTFSRFQRVVHDVSRELGKDIGLVIDGEDTELDKTVVEKIGDPLTHLVRNAIDHGIDSPEQRAARGKPARGTVMLNAFHDSGSIVIEVSDDGGGLNREKILAKAVERGLIEAGRSLSDAEIYALIFEPGFSTAEKVTNLSGRGVGMDVVKRNIVALRGSVGIASTPGEGTTVTVRLPLTLAIINGFQIGVGKAVFVVPLDMVDECVEFSAETGHDYTDLRGQVLPFIRLRELFDIDGPQSARPNIVVVKHAGQKFGIVVDTLLGEAQTVIKPLSKMFGQVRGISGSSILGSGDVALILDVPALMESSVMPVAAA
ncbi:MULTISPECIES: chemotaxis protein CheA [unclassified Rhizobacter]|uniref:chemotaxis protein CheA n=1 Tax=unclassified Rhizobacter TaxID=2640088 RepID=UPI0006F20667|nr:MULTISPECIES: chemotaxis protein CheA [unclassified Rhizobacter]KQU67730.1 chemotaxis protein CheA [Rhizobacter sp. Root29]KQW15386.1 chemotaxis protein CheA [Rhizobacter sp. Root1238]KRB24530.1 chemotaxis protein CheA [Rhizobacter sp. Root16D2]